MLRFAMTRWDNFDSYTWTLVIIDCLEMCTFSLSTNWQLTRHITVSLILSQHPQLHLWVEKKGESSWVPGSNSITSSYFTLLAVRCLTHLLQSSRSPHILTLTTELCNDCHLCIRGPPPTGLHFGPETDYIPVSLFKEHRYKIVFCVLYYIVIE